MSRLHIPSTSRSPARDGGETTSMDEYSDANSSPLSPDSPTQQLIFLQEPDDLPELELWQSDDENEEEEGGDLEGGSSRPRPQRQRSEDVLGGASLMRGATGVIGGRTAGLTGTQIFTYLISPTLKLGATSLLNQTLRSTSTDNHKDQGSQNELFPLPIPLAVLALFFAAGLNALAVQIWLMLGQYLRRWSFEGVVGEAFVGFTERRHGTRRNPWKKAVVRTTKVLVVVAASLLCAAYLRAAYLLLGIPPLWLSIIKPRLTSTSVSFRWVQDIKWHWVLFVSLISLASFAPSSLAHFISRSASLSFIGFSFLLPALLHVTVHTVRSPLSIIYPTSTASGSAADRNGSGMTESEEALLRKKERSLQKRRFIRRAGWDLAVWFLLLPVGAVSWGWWAGRVVGAW
ncbi:hypothetical protein M407DRAFT_9631 [Tulasnella calospora MUT 4182]|uniref:Uncharacterized protein n=1 Tax=Tulasnella calospora MUT 4182 TaxID=1051891 RepID=A0A0C3Q326_9AGAM|nr:hypothetical protein M407DRAFT_9631 [Tulasnella calospora MUT 4182]